MRVSRTVRECANFLFMLWNMNTTMQGLRRIEYNIRPNSSQAILCQNFVRTSQAKAVLVILYCSVHWVSPDAFTQGRLVVPLVLGLFESKHNKPNQIRMLPKTNGLFSFNLNHIVYQTIESIFYEYAQNRSVYYDQCDIYILILLWSRKVETTVTIIFVFVFEQYIRCISASPR